MTALLMPALMTAAGVASDTIHWTLLQRLAQRQAESAALAGADALAQNRNVADSVAAELADGMDGGRDGGYEGERGALTLARAPIIEQGPSSGPFAGDPLVVRVRLTAVAHLPFAGLFSAAGVPIHVEATAGLVEERMAIAIASSG